MVFEQEIKQEEETLVLLTPTKQNVDAQSDTTAADSSVVATPKVSKDTKGTDGLSASAVVCANSPTPMGSCGVLDSFAHIQIDTTVKKQFKQHLVFVVDVSGSMSTGVQSKSNTGSESHGFTILDLVKHSLLTIVNSLHEYSQKNKSAKGLYSISLVQFTDTSDILLTQCDMSDKKKVENARQVINSLTPLATTNIWAGLKKGYDCMIEAHQSDSNIFHQMMLFTDGVPNVHPGRGHVASMANFVSMNEVPSNHIVNTFGFGYSLESKLLEEIAIQGNGTFSFIPDAGMVGTIFIHFIASVLAQVEIKNAKLKITMKKPTDYETELPVDNEYALIKKMFPGQFPYSRNDCCLRNVQKGDESLIMVELPLGAMEFGQKRDIVLKNPTEIKNITIVYNGGEECIVPVVVKKNSRDVKKYSKVVRAHFFRAELCQFMHSMANARKGIFSVDQADVTNQTLRPSVFEEHGGNDMENARAQLLKIVNAFSNLDNGSSEPDAEIDDFEFVEDETLKNDEVNIKAEKYEHKLFEEIMKDAKGQITEAIETTTAWQKWGEFYYRSLGFAHVYQRRNNFKDFGVLCYGGKLFEEFVNLVNNVFDNTEPPKPSRKTATSRPVVSMSAYNNCYGPCFAASCLVKMFDGSEKRCDDIRAGDVVTTGNGKKGIIRYVTKTSGENMKVMKFIESGLSITPWHPMKYENEWQFPAEIENAEHILEGLPVVYNFLLEKSEKYNHSTLVINGIEVVALGHDLKENAVVSHEYFGCYENVERDLKNMRNIEGVIPLSSEGCCLKSMITGFVEKMVQNEDALTIKRTVSSQPSIVSTKVVVLEEKSYVLANLSEKKPVRSENRKLNIVVRSGCGLSEAIITTIPDVLIAA